MNTKNLLYVGNVFFRYSAQHTVRIKSTTSENVTLCILVEMCGRFGVLSKQLAAFVAYSAYSLTLKIEAVSSFETLVNLYQTTRRYTPEDSILYSHRLEDLKSNRLWVIFLIYRCGVKFNLTLGVHSEIHYLHIKIMCLRTKSYKHA
jgi:hypothetical protein